VLNVEGNRVVRRTDNARRRLGGVPVSAARAAPGPPSTIGATSALAASVPGTLLQADLSHEGTKRQGDTTDYKGIYNKAR